MEKRRINKFRIIMITLVVVTGGLIAIASLFEFGRIALFIIFGPVIHFIIFPFVIYFKFIDILYPALILAIVSSVIFCVLLIKNKSHKSIFITCTTSFFFILILYPVSLYLAESYIKKSALQNYNQLALEVNLNLSGWYKTGDVIHGKRHLGKAHAYIFKNGCKSNWSFEKRDFIKSRICK